jgi:hypothetical protein
VPINVFAYAKFPRAPSYLWLSSQICRGIPQFLQANVRINISIIKMIYTSFVITFQSLTMLHNHVKLCRKVFYESIENSLQKKDNDRLWNLCLYPKETEKCL